MFDKFYRCYSVSQTGTPSRVEDGDKILMPVSALDELSRMRVEYPLLFKLTNTRTNKASHCGVMEFSAEEGTVVLPNWSMLNMGLLEGDVVRVSNASLAKAALIKLRPHETAFVVEVSDPKSVLERCLRSFSCLTIGDTFEIPYLDRKFRFDVLEAKPDRGGAVSVIETDCEVDFAAPLDYVEPVSKKAKIEVEEEEKEEGEVSFKAFMGVGRRLDGSISSNNIGTTKAVSRGDKSQALPQKSSISNSSSKLSRDGTETGVSVKEEEKGFKPFTGKSYRLM